MFYLGVPKNSPSKWKSAAAGRFSPRCQSPLGRQRPALSSVLKVRSWAWYHMQRNKFKLLTFFWGGGAQSDLTWPDVVDLAPDTLWTFTVGDAPDLHSVGQCGVQILQHTALCIFRLCRRLSTMQRWRSESRVEISGAGIPAVSWLQNF